MDARIWSAKWRNWNISDRFLSCSGSIEKRKQWTWPETFALCMGTIPLERTWQENGFLVFKENHFDISDTPHLGRFSGFDEDSLNTLIHKDPRQCTRELANVMYCDHSTIVRYLNSMRRLKNRV